MYGSSPEEMIQVAATRTEEGAEVTLEGLKAGTEYGYYLEVSNGGSVVRTGMLRFRTSPNTEPVLGEMVLINKGPTTAVVQCVLVENGGEALSFLGFKYREETSAEELFVALQSREKRAFLGLG